MTSRDVHVAPENEHILPPLRLPVTIDIGHQSQGHFHFAIKLAIGSYRQNAIAIESEAGDSLT